MRTYVVLEPISGRDSVVDERVCFVREKFYWSALFFAWLWLIWHRLWLALLAWLAAVALLGGLVYALGLDPLSSLVALTLPSLLVAFEGSELRRRKLLRRGYRDAGVSIGSDLEDAERRFFAGQKAQDAGRANLPDRPSAPVVPVVAHAPPRRVIGLFPQPGSGQ